MWDDIVQNVPNEVGLYVGEPCVELFCSCGSLCGEIVCTTLLVVWVFMWENLLQNVPLGVCLYVGESYLDEKLLCS